MGATPISAVLSAPSITDCPLIIPSVLGKTQTLQEQCTTYSLKLLQGKAEAAAEKTVERTTGLF